MAGITLTIEVDDKGTVKVRRFADESKKAFDEMQKGPKAAQGALGGLPQAWTGLTAKLAAATAVIYGVGRAFSSFVNEAAQAEEIENRLRFALETTGYTWQYAKQAVDEFANSIQQATRFSDEQARQALTDMMMYTQDFAKAQMGAKLAMDMSIRTGQDLGSTSRLIGMAMSGNVEMLGRYIPELRNLDAVLGSNATMAQRAEYALKLLHDKFGGTAEADLKSYSGQLAQFRNAWSDLKETIGMHLLPVLKEAFDWFTKLIKAANEFMGGGDPAEKRRKILQNQLGILDDLYAKEQSLLESGKLRGSQIFLTEERINNILEQRKPILEEIALIEAKREESSKKLAAETRPDRMPAYRRPAETGKIEGLKLIKHWTEEIWQAEDKYYADSVARSAEILDRTHRQNLALQAQEEWIDSLQGAWHSTWLEAKLYEEAIEETIDANQRAIPELLKTTNDLGALWGNLAQGIGASWSQHVNNIIRGSESLREGLKNIFKSIGDAFVSEVTKMITQWLLFGSITGKGQKGGGWLTGGLWSGLLGWLFHGGGIVGQPGQTRAVPAASFIGAPRLHHGFAPDEYPAILRRGEGVFTPEQMKAISPDRGGQVVNITNNIWANDVDSFRRYLMANRDLLEGISIGAYANAKRYNKTVMRG